MLAFLYFFFLFCFVFPWCWKLALLQSRGGAEKQRPLNCRVLIGMISQDRTEGCGTDANELWNYFRFVFNSESGFFPILFLVWGFTPFTGAQLEFPCLPPAELGIPLHPCVQVLVRAQDAQCF